MDKLVAHYILTKLLFVLLVVVTLPFSFPAFWLAKSITTRSEQNPLGWGIGLILLALIVGLYWLAKKMSYHMTIEGKPFWEGAKAGLLDARLHLAFLPLVGHWFMVSPDKQDQDDDTVD